MKGGDNGKERKTNDKEAGDQVSQSAKEVAEKQNPIEAGQEEVGTAVTRMPRYPDEGTPWLML